MRFSVSTDLWVLSFSLTDDLQDPVCVSPLSCVCHVFPPLVSIFGLFPVLVKCHYELILVQPCLSNYL